MLNLLKKNRPYNKLLYNHYSKKVSPMIMIARMALLLIIAMIIIIAFIWFTNISSMLIQYSWKEKPVFILFDESELNPKNMTATTIINQNDKN